MQMQVFPAISVQLMSWISPKILATEMQMWVFPGNIARWAVMETEGQGGQGSRKSLARYLTQTKGVLDSIFSTFIRA